MQVYPTLPAVNFSFQTAAQMTPEMAAFRPRCVYAPLELLAERPEVLEPFREGGTLPVAILPAVVCTQEEEEELLALLDKVRAAGVEQVLAGNLGVALLARQAAWPCGGIRAGRDQRLYPAEPGLRRVPVRHGVLSADHPADPGDAQAPGTRRSWPTAVPW